MDKRKNKSSKETGNTFVVEPTGSATQVNLDGQWEHDFTDHTEHDEKAGK
ncbi:LAS seventeen-binding protein 3 [Sporotomaculum syntrophicum]|nr:LAS seventeen-binding protein 3 [Sporotomaculum syntrophicum]